MASPHLPIPAPRNLPTQLPDDWRVRYVNGRHFLQHESTAGTWETVAGPFRKRIGAVRRYQRQMYWSPWATPQQ